MSRCSRAGPTSFSSPPRTATATISTLKHKINVDNMDHIAGRELELNEIGLCNLSFSRALVFEPYETNRTLGGFILVDKISNATVAAGLIRFALRRASNVHVQALDVNRTARAEAKHQKPCCLWFTGLSGSGKSTIANLAGEAPACDGAPHLYSRRRQCAPRPQS